MKESYGEGVASRPGPQPCEGGREAALEALEWGIRRQGIELRNPLFSGADAAPTASQTAALATIAKDYAAVMARWEAIKSTDLPALNRQLSGAGLAVIQLKAEPEPASESENEE